MLEEILKLVFFIYQTKEEEFWFDLVYPVFTMTSLQHYWPSFSTVIISLDSTLPSSVDFLLMDFLRGPESIFHFVWYDRSSLS